MMKMHTLIFAFALVALFAFNGGAQRPPDGSGVRVDDTSGERVEPTGTLIVLSKASARASLVDLKSKREAARVRVGDGPHEVAVSPDGKTAVVTNYGQQTPGNTLTVIDIPGKEVAGTINLGDYHRPHGIVFLPNGQHVVVTAEVEQQLLVVDIANAEEPVVAAIPTNANVSHMVALSPDAKRAYVANIGSDSMTVIDLVSKTTLKTVPTGDGAEGIAVTPDGAEIWVTNRGEDTISVVNAESLEVTETIACEGFPIRIQFTPDGSKALVTAARKGDVAAFDTASKELIKRFDLRIQMQDETDEDGDRMFSGQFGPSSVPIGILIHPNGDTAYISSTMADRVTILNLASMKWEDFFFTLKEPDGLAYSPELLREPPKNGPTLGK